MCGAEQALYHQPTNTKIPIDLQNQSVTIQRWIRAIGSLDDDMEAPVSSIRAIKADVFGGMDKGPIGWHLEPDGTGVGYHYSDHFMDPSIARPDVVGNLYRTTLVKHGAHWFVLEFCEPMASIVDPGCQFYELEGFRDVITLMSDSEKDPRVLGFAFDSDDGELQGHAPADGEQIEVEDVAPEDDVDIQGHDIDGAVVDAQGVDIPDRIVVEPTPDDKIVVAGVELTSSSTLAVLKQALKHYNLSTSGSKAKCFSRLVNHQKKLELEIIHSAAKATEADLKREPHPQTLAVLPDQQTQDRHALTHVPFEPWCESCVAFRVRMDPHKRDDSTYTSGTPTVSFDFCHTKSVPAGHKPQDIKSLCCLMMVCSQTGYMHVTPVRHKNQFDLMVRELLAFSQLLGHTDITYMCDNEPSIKQLLRMTVNARLAMGLPTRATTPPAYDHGNSLVENSIGRLRPLAGSLVHALGAKLGLEISTNSHLWTWAMRHAAWIIRFSVTPGRGMTSFEMLANKPYTGKACQFGEPVFAYQKTKSKGNAKWRRMICLGKVENSFLLYNGENLILARSIRRINTCWKGHLTFYLNFKCASYDFKSGFGGRVVPTKSSRAPIAPGFNVPTGEIEPSKFFDEDGHAVRQKALEEQREDFEAAGMAVHDKKLPSEEVEQPLQEFGAEAVSFPNPIGIFDDDEDGGDGQNDAGGDEADVELEPNPAFSGLAAPSTPPELLNPAPISPSTATSLLQQQLHFHHRWVHSMFQ